MASVKPNVNACRIEENGVGDRPDNVGDPIAVPILRTEVEAVWIEVDHVDASVRQATAPALFTGYC